jgi:hypothetical protein
MGGRNEELIGKALKGKRQSVSLQTKLHFGDEKRMRASVERSLRRLETDHVDVLLWHGLHSDKEVSDPKMVWFMEKMKKEGKARFTGFSAHSRMAPLLREAATHHHHDVAFSRFRGGDRPGGFGVDSSLEDHSSLFYKGSYFVQLYASQPNASLLRKIATAVSQRIQDRPLPPPEIAFFPREGLQRHSIQYFPEGLLGHRFLGKGFVAKYLEERPFKQTGLGKEDPKEPQAFQLFLAIFKNPQEAEQASGRYRTYLREKGSVKEEIRRKANLPAWRAEDPYQGQILILQKKAFLMGAVGVRGPTAEIRLNALAEAVK